jgi:hypothetical protein
VRLGLLPKPETIGNLQRWDFGQVKAFIKAQNTVREAGGLVDGDPYMKGLRNGSAEEGKR